MAHRPYGPGIPLPGTRHQEPSERPEICLPGGRALESFEGLLEVAYHVGRVLDPRREPDKVLPYP